jgi:hypothetical protein
VRDVLRNQGDIKAFVPERAYALICNK